MAKRATPVRQPPISKGWVSGTKAPGDDAPAKTAAPTAKVDTPPATAVSGSDGANVGAGGPASAEAIASAPAVSGILLRVRSVSQRGRRRSGRAFGPEPVEFECAELSPHELDGLIADPLLIVIDVATGEKPD